MAARSGAFSNLSKQAVHCEGRAMLAALGNENGVVLIVMLLARAFPFVVLLLRLVIALLVVHHGKAALPLVLLKSTQQ